MSSWNMVEEAAIVVTQTSIVKMIGNVEGAFITLAVRLIWRVSQFCYR